MGQVWFGTREHMQWVPAPAVDVSAGKQGHATQSAFLGGGASVRRSKSAAKRFGMSWNLKAREEIQPILDYADGMYGNGPIYYLNPFAADRNMLPAYVAAPYMNYYDGPFIVNGVRPTLSSAGNSTNGYPVDSAVYSMPAGGESPGVFIPIPPGYVAHVGAVYSVQTSGAVAGVSIFPTWGSGSLGDGILVGPSVATSTTRTSLAYTPAPGEVGITLKLTAEDAATLLVRGIMVQVLPNGAVPPPGGFISGQGQSGMDFVSQPSVSEYSAAMDRVGVSAELIETEAWTWQ